VKQGGRQVSQKACRQEEAVVGTERLGDRQPDRGGVRKQKQAGGQVCKQSLTLAWGQDKGSGW
jgi:hypothetical protein